VEHVAVITDIHGNLPALQAALARIDELGIERTYCGGEPASLYERLAGAETADTLVFGHTHKPWIHDYGGVRFINCGSVGKPKDGDPRGAFAILADGPDEVAAHIERVTYDAQTVAAQVRDAGLPGEYADKLLIAA
jgi:predicted phosphodiesterase